MKKLKKIHSFQEVCVDKLKHFLANRTSSKLQQLSQSGMSLIETIVGLALIAIVFAGMGSIMSSASKTQDRLERLKSVNRQHAVTRSVLLSETGCTANLVGRNLSSYSSDNPLQINNLQVAPGHDVNWSSFQHEEVDRAVSFNSIELFKVLDITDKLKLLKGRVAWEYSLSDGRTGFYDTSLSLVVIAESEVISNCTPNSVLELNDQMTGWCTGQYSYVTGFIDGKVQCASPPTPDPPPNVANCKPGEVAGDMVCSSSGIKWCRQTDPICNATPAVGGGPPIKGASCTPGEVSNGQICGPKGNKWCNEDLRYEMCG